MLNLAASQVWFVTGSQHLYGPQTLATVADHANAIAAALDDAPAIPVRVVPKPVLTGSDSILALVREANADPACVGLITWMHTFSPAKMWIVASRRWTSRSSTSTPSTTARSPGPTSTWTS